MRVVPLPPFWLFLSKAFDRGVLISVRQWPWLIACGAALVAMADDRGVWSYVAIWAVYLIWFTAAMVAALRMTRPGFTPTRAFYTRIAGAFMVYEILVTAGMLLLVLPGLYFASRLWVTTAAVGLEDKGVGQALARSWDLTRRAFWPTFGLVGVIFVADVASIAILGYASREMSLLSLAASNKALVHYTIVAMRIGLSLYFYAVAISAKLLWLPVLAALPAPSAAMPLPTPSPTNPGAYRRRALTQRDEAPIETPRLWLEPIVPEHAKTLYAPLQDPLLYRFVSQPPPESESALRRRFELLGTGRSPDGSQIWLNWAARAKTGPYVGLIQATIEGDHALIGYDIFVPFWRNGYGKEACGAMVDVALREYGVTSVTAVVDADNAASIALLERLGFSRAWTGPSDDMPGHTDHRYERVLG